MIKKIFNVIGFVIMVIIGVATHILILGYCVDILTMPSFKAAGEQALKELVSIRREGEGNAWNYYAQAIDKMGEREFNKDIDTYLRGEINRTKEIEDEFRKHQDITDIIYHGTQQPFCSIPLEYEKGIALQLPNFVALLRCSKTYAAQALGALEKGATEDGLSQLLQGMTFAKHTISGCPALITYMVGIVVMGVNLSILEIGLSTGAFNQQQLQKINHFLHGLEHEVPSLIWALEGEHKLIKISFANKPFFDPLFSDIYILESDIMFALGIRFSLWQYLFSPRLASMKAFTMWDKVLLSMKSSAQEFRGTAEHDIQVLSRIDKEQIQNYKRQNPVFALMIPKSFGMFKRSSKTLAKIRLLNTVSLIWQFYLENGHFPKSLAEIESSLAKDPYRGNLWDYTHTKDSVVVKSPGNNLSYGDEDDLSITLKKSTIKNYRTEIRKKQ